MNMGPGRNERELTRAEQMVKGLSPEAMRRAVFGAARHVEALDFTGDKPIKPEDLKLIEVAQQGLKAYRAAGVEQGADLPAKAEAANPASGKKTGGFIVSQMLQACVTGAAYWAMGPAAAVGVGAALGGYELGKMTGLWPSGNPAMRPGDEIAAAGMRGYSVSPQKKGSMVIGGGTSFAKSADRTPQASLTGVGRADVLGKLAPQLASPFDELKKTQITPESYKAANKLAGIVEQQADNARQSFYKAKFNLLDPNVVANNSPFNNDYGAQMWAYHARGGRGTLLETGMVDRREAQQFLDGQQRHHQPTPGQQAQLAAVAPTAAPAPGLH